MHAHCRRGWQPSLAMPRRRDDSVGAAGASTGSRPPAVGVRRSPTSRFAVCKKKLQYWSAGAAGGGARGAILLARCAARSKCAQSSLHSLPRGSLQRRSVPYSCSCGSHRSCCARARISHTHAAPPHLRAPPRSRSLSIRHHVEGRHGVHRRGGRQGALQEARQRGAAHHVRARAGLPVAAGAPRRAPRHAVIPPLPAQAVDV